MYYPSFFGSPIRPFESVGTLGSVGAVRERLDNPLDLSVKQVAGSRPEGPDHDDLQMMMEHRKLVAAAAAAGMQSGAFGHQMPLLDGLYGYKTFGQEERLQLSGPMSGSAAGLIGQSLSSFNPNASNMPGVNPQFGLMPGLLQQNRDLLTPTPFPIDPAALPYHMRLNNSAAAAALAMNNAAMNNAANQRAAIYGHSGLPPGMAGTFGVPHPHLSLYSHPDLLSDMRRPDPEARSFSDHLQRLREQSLQSNKFLMDPLGPSLGHTNGHHGHHSASSSSGKCNCCVGSLPSAMLTPMTSTISGKNSLNNSTDSNHCSPAKKLMTIDSINGDFKNHDLAEHSPINQSKVNLWSPQNIQPPTAAAANLLFGHQQKDAEGQQRDNGLANEKLCDVKNNGMATKGHNNNHNNNQMNYFNKENSLNTLNGNNNEIAVNKSLKPEFDCAKKREDCQPEITIISGNSFDGASRNQNLETRPRESQETDNKALHNEATHHNERTHHPGLATNGHATAPTAVAAAATTTANLANSATTATATASSNNKAFDSRGSISSATASATATPTPTSASTGKLPRARISHENQVLPGEGLSYDNNILNGKTIGNAAINMPLIGNNNSINANSQPQQRSQVTNEIKLSQFKSHFTQELNNRDERTLNDQQQAGDVLNSNQTSQAGLTIVKGNNNNSKSNGNSNNSSSSGPATGNRLTKQLKEYKLLPKNQNLNAIDKNKRQPKEMKTVEVQCDGPDWTPIVLPAQLKSRLEKAARRKMMINSGESKNNGLARQLMNQKKEARRKKKCKQQHNHRSRTRSRSPSSSSTGSSRSSPERKRRHSAAAGPDGASGTKRKRSMLKCIANSDGFVADKIKRKARDANLIATDPSQLGREERALQLAMKHFERQEKPADKANRVNRAGESADALAATGNHRLGDSNNKANNCSNGNNNNVDVNNDSNKNSCNNSDKKAVESATKLKKKANKKLRQLIDLENEEVQSPCQLSLFKPKKMDAKREKRKLRERILENILDGEQKSDEDGDDDEAVGRSAKKKERKSKINEKCDDGQAKRNGEPSSQSVEVEAIGWKQKKVISNARRRRFRSGLDMIRHPHNRRKKSRVNHGHGSTARRDENSRTNNVGEYNKAQGSESGSGSLPTEMKRLMVNKAIGETLLQRAARSNRKDVVLYCLDSNTCDINTRDNAGFTPLHECCTRGHLGIAKILLQNGADVNASAAGGIRPLHDAIENNHLEVARLLLAYGADPNISTYAGLTPIKLAKSKSMVEFLKGFLADITGEVPPSDSDRPVLAWKFAGSTSFLDPNESGFNVFEGAPSDGDGVEPDDFLFEVSDHPLDPTYRIALPGEGCKSYNFLRLSDVLKRTGLTKEEFAQQHSSIEITSIPRSDFDSAATSQLLAPAKPEPDAATADGFMVDVVRLDDQIRTVLGIETVRLR